MPSSALFSTVRDGNAIMFTLASDIDLVHPVIRLSEGFVQQCGVSDTSNISLVVRELLSNAIMHGNKNISSRSVTCRMEYTGERMFRIVVEDEGEGFDFASLDLSFPDDPRAITKRGYILILRLCSALEFNDRGNRVTVFVKGLGDGGQSIRGGSQSANAGGGAAIGNIALQNAAGNICRVCFQTSAI